MDNEIVAELRELYFSTYGRLGVCEYQIEHPAFAKWKASRNYSLRLGVILDTVGKVEGKRVLDIGCCEGAFSHHLAKKGARVTGTDYCSWRTDLAEVISKLYGLLPDNPKFIVTTFEKYLGGEGIGHFDFILFLSLFHHCLRKGPESAWQKMALVSKYTDMMFLEADLTPIHCRRLVQEGYKQTQMREVIPQLIVERSGFRAYRSLPTRRSNRPFFVFTK